ncbi:MAG: sigma-54 interaction domain-containing protein [Anaerovoracaceae bacterium]
MINPKAEEILNNLNTGVYVVDKSGEYIFLNDTMQEITGASREEVLHTNVMQQLENDSFEYSISLRAAREKRPLSLIQLVKTPYKTYRQLVYAKPVFDKNGEVEYVTVEVNPADNLQQCYQRAIMGESTSSLDAFNRYDDLDADDIISVSQSMKDIFAIATKIAPSDTSVLITGETGTGKNRLASFIHEHSNRSHNKMVSVNCAALPSNLLESELFGYAKGAFTGANPGGKRGLFDEANGGTLLLDEINSMPLELQGKLLHVLETHKYLPLGSNVEKNSDFRLICLSNSSLKECVKEGTFRGDLYYRINVLPLHVPSLSERREDIVPLSIYYCSYYSNKNNTIKVLSSGMCKLLEEHPWPGNVRQLKNAIERLVIMSPSDKIEIEESMFSLLSDSFEFGLPEVTSVPYVPNIAALSGLPSDLPTFPLQGSLKDIMDDYERTILKEAFARYKSTYKVAQALNTPQSTIARKKGLYGL